MKDFNKDLDALNTPWVLSPFFSNLIDYADVSKNEIQLLRDFNSKGYVIIDLELSDSFIDDLNGEIKTLSKSDNIKTNSSFFSYNDSPRIVDAGRDCAKVIDLALHEKVLSLLKVFYRKEPIPFSTINFLKGTEQPLHSDTIHFASTPKGYLSTSWVALEDTDENNGALRIVEGSHKLKDIDYYDLKIKPAKNMKIVENIYREYEQYVRDLISILDMKEKIISMARGSAMICSGNLLHGGGIIHDHSRSRYSQVTHYNFEGCDYYFHPFFSTPPLGKYVKRDLGTLDIRNLKEKS